MAYGCATAHSFPCLWQVLRFLQPWQSQGKIDFYFLSPCSFPWHALRQVLFQGLQFEGVKKHPLNAPPKKIKAKAEMLKQELA